MDIDNILNSLGLDLTNPEVKRGAIEALEAILNSRSSGGFSGGSNGGSFGGGDAEEIELDPDLLQPSLKNPASFDANDDIEIEDEEHILDQIQHNDSDADFDEDESDTKTDSDSTTDSEENSTRNSESEIDDTVDAESETTNTIDSDETEKSEVSADSEENSEEANAEANKTVEADNDSENDDANIEINEPDTELSDEDADEIDENDLLDDETKDLFTDMKIKSKQEARKIKRERTLQAAKKALTDAQGKKVAPALIRELENAIAALESLTEAAKKSLNDLSDDEFNLIINRIFDAIDAVGDKSLTFTSDAERELRAQEIKNDLADKLTQAELSAEDVAKIRAENQAVKAREQEANKYKARSRDSFKGFQDFLNSLYRAIALQVHTDEVQDDTWSALNRRHSGAGVLQPGKRVQELPNKKIPIIDFYFDCSASWGSHDIAVGQRAVSKLADMEADGQIKINIYYFSDGVYTDAQSARARGSTSGWNEIVKNVISTQATNVIIMTDSDMENWWNGPHALSYTVPGYVWYLWRDGENAPRLPRDLKGRGGTQQFTFSHGDL